VTLEITPIDEQHSEPVDALLQDAAEYVVTANEASTAALQRQFKVGNPRAVRLMKALEGMGVVGPHEGPKSRKILIGLAELERKKTG